MPMNRMSVSDAMSASVCGAKPKSIGQRHGFPPSMLGDKSVYTLRCQAGTSFSIEIPSRISGTNSAYDLDMILALRYGFFN